MANMANIVSTRGLTLLEVMVSIIILTVGILGLAPLVGVAIYNNSYSSETMNANAIAQQEIEMLINQSNYGALPFISTIDSVNGVYTVYRLVEDNSTNPAVLVGLFRISVSLTWTDLEGQTRTVYYSMLKPKP